LYNEFYTSSINLENPNTEIIAQLPEFIKNKEHLYNPNPILEALQALKYEKVEQNYKRKYPDFLKSVTRIFTENEISCLMKLILTKQTTFFNLEQ
jgi:hypothetical protein